ncbi:hypothetical protein HWV62_17312 [Athelia sp. TMB]|nr:hypothetical protein HWV62_17312 [Athelia sp. TMB]
MSIPTAQKTWKVVRQGKPSKALEFDEHSAVPSELKRGEVLVKVQAAALNPVGYKLMQLMPNMFANRPFPAENDFSGVIAAVHESTDSESEFKVGDRVFGIIPVEVQRETKQGALAQYLRTDASYLARLPTNVTFTQAAGFALAAETAWQGLFKFGGLEPGQSVFINGGSSSVGCFAIQIAKAKGCKVVASASSKNEEYVKSWGADEFIDYTAGPLHLALSKNPPSPKFHVILDAVGLDDPSLYLNSRSYLAPNGIYLSTGPMPSFSLGGMRDMLSLIFHAYLRPRWLGGVPSAFKIFMLKHNREDLHEIKELIQEGKLKPAVDSVFAFEDTLKAYDRLMSHRAKGKVVIRVDPEAE